MIICIECAENSKNLLLQQEEYPDWFPMGECSLCNNISPLVDSYRESPAGKYFDALGNELKVGDKIAYSVAAGRSSGKIIIGTIYSFGRSTVRVEVETVDWEPTMKKRKVQTVRSFFNYHPGKCLRLSTI